MITVFMYFLGVLFLTSPKKFSMVPRAADQSSEHNNASRVREGGQ